MTTKRAMVRATLVQLLMCAVGSCTRPEQPRSEPQRALPGTATLTNPGQSSTQNSTQKRAAKVTPLTKVVAPVSSSPFDNDIDSRQALTQALDRARQGGKTRIDYTTPGATETRAYTQRLGALLVRSASGAPALDTPPRGFRLESIDAQHVAILEEPDLRRGACAVVLRLQSARPLAIEAPHSFFDEGTLAVALDLFTTSHARMLLVNTVHRYRSSKKDQGATSESDDDRERAPLSDVAHAPASFFLAAHEAFLESIPSGVVVQIHGFSDSSIEGADAVISAARTASSVEPIAQQLQRQLQLRVLVYPKDTRKLGGTTNVQAKLSRRMGQRFIHLELSRSLRQRLAKDGELATRFASIIAAGVR